MREEALAFATRLETLMPRVLTKLFQPSPQDPLAEISYPQLRLIRLLMISDRTPSELAAELNLSASAITQLVNRMNAHGLIDRKDDERDRRIRKIALSEYGRSQMEERQARRIERAYQVLEKLTAEERDAIYSALAILDKASTHSSKESMQTIADQEHPVRAGQGTNS